MENEWRELVDLRSALSAEFDTEIWNLVSASSTSSPVESVMRIRALSEIADALDTEALVHLAVDVTGGLAANIGHFGASRITNGR